jgi:hypothetical protein
MKELASSEDIYQDVKVLDEPAPPADGRDGHWVKLGHVGVDSASIAITDLAASRTMDNFSLCTPAVGRYSASEQWAGDCGTGIRFWAGFGDGGYDIWAWVVDYGADGDVDERIAQVVVTLIDDAELANWMEL